MRSFERKPLIGLFGFFAAGAFFFRVEEISSDQGEGEGDGEGEGCG